MKCVHCNRPLTKPAVSIPGRNGLMAWGPKCAKVLRLAASLRRPPKGQRLPDRVTMDLFDGDLGVNQPPQAVAGEVQSGPMERTAA